MGLGDSVLRRSGTAVAASTVMAPKAPPPPSQFWGYDTDNTVFDDPHVFGFPVGNPGSGPVTVRIQRSTGAGTWEAMLSGVVPAGQVRYFRIMKEARRGKDAHIEGSGRAFGAYRIDSDGPVVAYQINADDEDMEGNSAGSTLLLPTKALGLLHFAITPPERGVPIHDLGGPDHAFVAIVGAREGTTSVSVKSKGATLAGGGVAAIPAGGSADFVLAAGEVLQLETSGTGEDLSGSEILSDRPVAVFAGNVCGGFDPRRLDGYPYKALNCDHIEEQMVPVRSWGKSFVFPDMRIPTRQPSDAVWGRIVASEDGTTITFDAGRPLAGLPASAKLDRGGVFALEIASPAKPLVRAHFTIQADKPIEVESFMGIEEGGAVVVPADQFLDDYLVSTHPWFLGNILVTRKLGTVVKLDGVPMPDSVFAPAGGGYQVSFVEMPQCDSDLGRCGHRIEGAKVGVTVTANGGTCNYCYAGGAGSRCINRSATVDTCP